MLKQIRLGAFAPDATRSGVVVPPQARRPASSSSSSSSIAASASSDDPEAGGEDGAGDTVQDRFLQNSRSKRVHVQQPDGGLVCGIEVPRSYVILDSLPPPGQAKLCTRCF